MSEPTILAETIAGIERILGDELDRIRIERAPRWLYPAGNSVPHGYRVPADGIKACLQTCRPSAGRT
ncbi:MAG TPA: hypothetical protein VFG12_07485 [Rhodopila sp.]|nr:hypothetical protein [Rhodopila sp.]